MSPAYARAHLPGGSFRPETYAFGEGGAEGGAQKDATIDRLRLIDVARLITPSLASQQYLPCNPRDPSHTDLLIMVYWGTTTGTDGTAGSPQYQMAQALVTPPSLPPPPPPTGQGLGAAMVSDPSMSGRANVAQQTDAIQSANDSALQQSVLLTAMANRQCDRQDRANAAVLGYANEMKRLDAYRTSALNLRRQDLVDEVEESRYYVVLLAYDFQTLWRHKQRRLLWETRFSIRERRHDFGGELAAMAQEASHYFGQDSHGLIHEHLPETVVSVGEPKVLGYEPEPKP